MYFSLFFKSFTLHIIRKKGHTMSAFSQFFLGSPAQARQLPTMTEQQQQILNQLLTNIGSPITSGIQNLQNILGGGPGAFSEFERPSMRQFQEEIIPSLTERFAGLGAGSSSGFQQTLARAGERLSENLAAQRAGLQSQALGQLQNLLGAGLTPQFQYTQTPGTQGLLPQLLQSLGGAASFGLGGGLANLLGRRNPSSPSPYYDPYTGMQGGQFLG